MKTRRVGERCTLSLSRAQTSSRLCGAVVRRVVPPQMSSSSLDYGSKLRSPPAKALVLLNIIANVKRIGSCKRLNGISESEGIIGIRGKTFDQVSGFDRGRIVAYGDCGISIRKIGSRVGRNQTTVPRICDRWMQEGTTDRRG
ncbi:transposable element Tcb1 transposase [Trichonephila clavipes]|nr:transposable element Tcb1 transposase [Trichonephila clavipes]